MRELVYEGELSPDQVALFVDRVRTNDELNTFVYFSISRKPYHLTDDDQRAIAGFLKGLFAEKAGCLPDESIEDVSARSMEKPGIEGHVDVLPLDKLDTVSIYSGDGQALVDQGFDVLRVYGLRHREDGRMQRPLLLMGDEGENYFVRANKFDPEVPGSYVVGIPPDPGFDPVDYYRAEIGRAIDLQQQLVDILRTV